jgi:hypothetical protein
MRRVLLLAVSLVAAGCAGAPQPPACRVNADCASAVCQPDGRCAPLPTDGGAEGAPQADGAPGDAPALAADGAGTDGPAGDGGPVVCSPNHDGTITRAEVPLAAGLHATFEVAENLTFDTTGTPITGGRRWDLSGSFSGDHGLLLETQSLAGLWFASSFSGATYAARLSDTNDLLGVYEITADALLLRGVASPQSGLTQTLLTYDPPVEVLAFPLHVGASWTTTSTVAGQASGVSSYYTERYDSQVDTAGELLTPYGTFADVLRIRTVLTRTIGIYPTVSRTFAFAAECFGTVATVRSQDNETSTEFTSVAELWRLTP